MNFKWHFTLADEYKISNEQYKKITSYELKELFFSVWVKPLSFVSNNLELQHLFCSYTFTQEYILLINCLLNKLNR